MIRLAMCVAAMLALKTQPVPPIAVIVDELSIADENRLKSLPSYSVVRHYTLTLSNSKPPATMDVKLDYAAGGTKHFTIVKMAGADRLQRHIFQRMLDGEIEAAAH